MKIEDFIESVKQKLDKKVVKDLIFEFKNGDLYINNKGNLNGPTILGFNKIEEGDFNYHIDSCVEYIKAYHSNRFYTFSKIHTKNESINLENIEVKQIENRISKELFAKTINNIRNQMVYDSVNTKVLVQEFGQDSALATFFENSKLIKNTIELLQIFFPRDENGFCEIEHYCFKENFGKPSPESEYITPEMLYDKLIK